MDYRESVKYLYSLGHEVQSAKYRLETIRVLLEDLDDPQKSFASVIVAGTNGKGSTAAMIEAVARRAGHRTGLYTSPHLTRIEERMQVVGREIGEETFARHATTVRASCEDLVTRRRFESVPTFFEQVTAIAFNFFKEASVKLAILEVGLGGRLDATNIVDPIFAVLTAIDYDHQDVLGSEISQIAAEKAAVIKRGGRAVIAKQPHPLALEVLMQRCLEMNVLPVFAGEPTNISASGDGRPSFDYESSKSKYTSIRLGLRGLHQIDNATAAIEALELLSECGYPIERDALFRGLRVAEWPGRLEITDTKPRLLLDGAHNRGGSKKLRKFLDDFVGRPVTLIFGAMADKDIAGMAAELFPAARTIVLTRVQDSRAATGLSIGEAALAGARNVIFTESVKQALSWARSVTGPEELIVVAGSLHLIGDIKRLLEAEDEQTAFIKG